MKKSTTILRRISFRNFGGKGNEKNENQNEDGLESVESAADNLDGKPIDQTISPSTQQPQDLVNDAIKDKVRNKATRKPSQIIKTTCPVCENDYQQPKILPCEHVFCQKCLKPYVNPKSLLSCPTCHREFPIEKGDPSNLPDDGASLAAIKSRRSNTVRRKSSSSTNNTCFICHVSAGENQYCLHCQKVFCKLCLGTHTNVLKTQLDGMRENLKEIKTKIEDKHSAEVKFNELRAKVDNLERSKIEDIQRSKAILINELEQKKKDERKAKKHLAAEMNKILDETNHAANDQDHEDTIKKFIEIYNQFTKSMQLVDKLSDSYEVTDNFQLREIWKPKQKKSLTLQNSNAPAMEIDIPLKKNVETNFSTYKKQRIGDLPITMRASCVAICPSNGHIYVCMPERKIVQVFSHNGKFVTAIEGDFFCPNKVSFSPKYGEVYILDKWKNNVTVMSDNNDVLNTLFKPGHNAGQLQTPCGMSVDRDTGNILIADTGNNRVQMFGRKGDFINFIGGTFQKSKSGRIIEVDSELKQPEDVSTDGVSIAVADTGHNCVRVYSMLGKPLHVIGMKGYSNGEFNLPTSLTIHKGNYVVVAESGNQRVQIFSLVSGKFLCCLSSLKGIITSVKESPSEELIMTEEKTNSVFMLKQPDL